MSALSVADVLDRAADLIEPEGAWTQNTFARKPAGDEYLGYSEDGDIRKFGASCFCVFGALAIAEDVKDPEAVARRSAETLKRSLGFEYLGQVSAWNDAPERTQAEVVAKLRAAAALARGESPHV